MSLRLAASMGALQTLVSMSLSFASIKITSVYLGPAGLGTLGQLNHFMAMMKAVIVAGVGTGLVRRTAQLQDDPPSRDRVISTALRAVLAAGLVASLVVALGSEWLASELLHDAQLIPALWIFAAAFSFGLVTTVVLSCANGAKDFRTLAFINIGTNIGAFVLIALFAPTFGLKGALFALAGLPVFSALIALALAHRHKWWPRRVFSHQFVRQELPSLMAFVPLSIISAVGMPLVQLLIRESVAASDGMRAVGFLQGVMRISDLYLGVATGVFAMYFFPRFTEIREADELTRELTRGLLVIVPAVSVLSLLIYLFRDWVVRIVFTPEFLPMRDLFAWQMIGNTFKIAGWLFGFVLLAKANSMAMAALEVAALSGWWLLAVVLVSNQGVGGAPQAYALTYAVYLVVTASGVGWLIRRMRLRQRGAAT